jgi:hypothetical protein
LKRKVPPFLFTYFENRVFWTLFGIASGVFFLYGPIPARIADHNGYRYLFGPIVCMLPPILFYILKPFNPYRGALARYSGMVDMDRRAPEAKRLVETFRSPAARRFILLTSVKISAIWLSIMAVITAACANSLNWSFRSPWLGQGLIGGCIASLVALGSEYIAWGVRTWMREVAGDGEDSRP